MITRSGINAPMLAGLYLARFDQEGLKHLGFDTFTEAFNVLGFALGSKPTTVKNYRQEFDPLFPNPRLGWHKRPPRPDRLHVMENFPRSPWRNSPCFSVNYPPRKRTLGLDA